MNEKSLVSSRFPWSLGYQHPRGVALVVFLMYEY